MSGQRTTESTMLDFSALIAERTRDFIGREWVLGAIGEWLVDPGAPRFFLVSGGPGSGKTALAAQLARLSTGEVAYPPGVEALGPGFLGAVHFCAAAESRWISPIEFARSVAVQLANRYPIYHRALAESGLDRPITINIQQQVGVAAAGAEVTGVIIETLQVGAMPTEEAFLHLLLRPLEKLYAEADQHGLQVVILVDSLNEARVYSDERDILWLLGQAAALPRGVRFIVTSRDDAVVRDTLGELRECSLTAGPEAEQERYRADIKRYVETALAARGDLTGRLAVDLSPEVFVAELVSRSEGNFLYIHHLLKMLASQEGPIDRTGLDRLPAGLDGVYRSMLDRLVGKRRDKWDEQYGPLLGTLAVVREALTEAQWEAFSGVEPKPAQVALADFLDKRLDGGGRAYFAIYNRSFADFLLDETWAKGYWCRPAMQDARIVAHYKRGATAWGEVAWATIDNYGLLHLAEHLVRSGNRQELYALLCPSFMEEKHRRFASHQLFTQDVALAIAEAQKEQPPNLPQVVRAALLYASLGSLANAAPPAAAGVLAQLGQDDRALGFAVMMPDPVRRCEAYRLIGEALLAEGRPAGNVLAQALAAAEAIPQQADRGRALAALARPMIQAGALSRFGTAVANLEGEGARATALSALARELAQSEGGAEEALTLIQQVKGASARAAVLSAVIEEMALDNAAVLGRALAAAEELEDGALGAAVLVTAVRALAMKGDRARALEIAARAEAKALAVGIAEKPAEAGGTPVDPEVSSDIDQPGPAQVNSGNQGDRSKQYSLLAMLVPALGTAGAWDKAYEVIDDIKSSYHNGLARQALAPLLVRAGLLDDARKVVDGITFQVIKTAAVRDVTQVLAESGQVTAALDTIATMAGEAERIAARAGLALALARLGQTEKAAEVALEACADLRKADAKRVQTSLWQAVQNAVSETIKSADERLYLLALSQSAQALAYAGRFAEAREAADGIIAGPALDAGTRFRRAMEGKGDFGRAAWMVRMERLYRGIYKGYLRAAALRALATAQACAGRMIDTVETVGAIEKARWRAEALTEAGAALAAMGKNVAAQEMIVRALAQGEIPANDYLRLSVLFALDSILDDLEQETAGVPAKALNALVHIRQPAVKSQALQESLRQAAELAEAGQFVRATRASAVRGDNLVAALAVGAAVAAVVSVPLTRFQTLGDAVRMVGYVPEALNLAANIWKIDAFCELAGRLGTAESLEDAQMKAGLLMDVALALGGKSTDPEQLALVAAGAQALVDPEQRVAVLALTGGFFTAAAEAIQIQDPIVCATALAGVAQAMALGGYMEQARSTAILALTTISPVDDPEAKERVMHEIGRALALISRRGRVSQAFRQATSAVETAGERLTAAAEDAGVVGTLTRHMGTAGERLAAAAVDNGVVGTLARRTGWGRRLLGKAAPPRTEPVISKPTLPAPPDPATGIADDAESAEETLPAEARTVLSVQIEEDAVMGRVWMAESLLQQGDKQSALQNAQELLNQVETLSKHSTRAIALTTIARVLVSTGDSDAGLRAAGQAAERIESVPDPDARVALLVDLALLLAEAGESRRAAELAEQARGQISAVQDKGTQASMLVTLSHFYSRQKQQDRAVALFGSALASARLAGRPAVFSVLKRAAPDLVGLDDGNTLREIRDAVSEVEGWWVTRATTGANERHL